METMDIIREIAEILLIAILFVITGSTWLELNQLEFKLNNVFKTWSDWWKESRKRNFATDNRSKSKKHGSTTQ